MKIILTAIGLLLIAFLGGFYVQGLITKEDRYSIQPYVEKAKAIKKEADARASFRGLISREQSSLLAVLSTRNGGRVSDRDWLLLERIYHLFGPDARLAVAIAQAESGFRCDAYHFNTNKTVDHSIFQVNDVHSWRGDLNNCEENINVAYKIYKEQGFRPWVTYNYRKYLVYL